MTTETEQSPLLDRLIAERPARVADLGAGLGRHTQYLLDYGIDVTAVDFTLTPELAAIVEKNPGRCMFLQGDITRPTFPDNSVEAIWASHCLEHFADPIE